MKTIYLADDDEDDRMLLREALVEVIDEVRIVEVCDGAELLKTLRAEVTGSLPALVLMDINMPRINGMEALKMIKSDAGLTNIPVLMMSTLSGEQVVNNAFEIGICGYFAKPITADEFTRLAEAVDLCFLQTQHPVDR